MQGERRRLILVVHRDRALGARAAFRAAVAVADATARAAALVAVRDARAEIEIDLVGTRFTRRKTTAFFAVEIEIEQLVVTGVAPRGVEHEGVRQGPPV